MTQNQGYYPTSDLAMMKDFEDRLPDQRTLFQRSCSAVATGLIILASAMGLATIVLEVI